MTYDYMGLGKLPRPTGWQPVLPELFAPSSLNRRSDAQLVDAQ
jgi:hypothetical protein